VTSPLRLIVPVLLALAPPVALAQGAKVAFGGLKQDTSLPVEVKAEQLAVNNLDGRAVFTGNVIVAQGEMRLAAPRVEVEYSEDGGRIERLLAFDGVTLTNVTDAAEAAEAVYTIDTGIVVMTGDVLLTQGPSALSGQMLTIDLTQGTGLMEGGVSTIFVPGAKE
jgi:lipopolysaccharide export system protein LptA